MFITGDEGERIYYGIFLKSDIALNSVSNFQYSKTV